MPPIRVQERSEGPLQAKEVALQCPHCQGVVYARFTYQPTAEQRQQTIRAAIMEHRGLCSQAPPEEGRIYKISYPRA